MTEATPPQPDVWRVRRRQLLAGAPLLAALPTLGHAEAPTAAEIRIDNFTFQPAALRIKRGTSITWVNHDDIPHSIVLAALQIHSHPLDTDEKFSYLFEKAGIFAYVCGLHPHMKGQVLVSA